MSAPYKKKLIEVSLPLEAINRESAREKSIRHGHPSTLHLWWARRPLAACRAVLFAQLVDDPSAHPDQFPTEADQEVERKRLFDIIERLVVWENINDEALLKEAREEILKSTDGNPPAILDPFAGGGSIPLEAQRLGFEAHASDLNPVAVLINKALIEIPPIWAGRSPVFPDAAQTKLTWPNATGLAEDVRRYGKWMRDEAERRVGQLYPTALLSDGTEATVIAWLWARTVHCPNPGCGIDMPLVKSWWLSKKPGKEAYLVAALSEAGNGCKAVHYEVRHDPGFAPSAERDGTVGRSGAKCIACGGGVPLSYIKTEGLQGRMGASLTCVVAEGVRRRIYTPATDVHLAASQVSIPDHVPDAPLSTHPQYMGTPRYGLERQSDLFTPRQLVLLSELSSLVREARDQVEKDALSAGLSSDPRRLQDGGTGAAAYADSVAVYLAFGVDRVADRNSAVCGFDSSPKVEGVRNVFARQAIPMVWDFAETNPFGPGGGNIEDVFEYISRAVAGIRACGSGVVESQDAATRTYEEVLVSTDPPYYDNVPYADLSDFFYGWLRASLKDILPSLFATVQTPKAAELVADQYRQGGRRSAAEFFESGFRQVFSRIRMAALHDAPITVFYAFKQTDLDEGQSASTGWQKLLEGMIHAGWEVTATWPMRTELGNRMRSRNSNALASSIVLALRPRPVGAETISRRGLVSALHHEIPLRLRELQQGSIAPVDLAQSAIGPGMAIFSRYSRVLEADGSEMSVRTALALINQVLDEALTDQEGDFDAETRFCVRWFSEFEWSEAPFGRADDLSKATNTSVSVLERGGVFRAAAGKARLLAPHELSLNWDPARDKEISIWEVAIRLGHALLTAGTERAGDWMRESAPRVDLEAVKELAYLMFSVCERKGWTDSAMLFNALGTSWSDIAVASRAAAPSGVQQESLEFGDEEH